MSLIRLFIAILSSCFSLFCETVARILFQGIHNYKDFYRCPVLHNGHMHVLRLSKHSLIAKKITVIGKTHTDIKLKSFKQICYVSLL